VPGISVDRAGGESRFITVRGFGPEFNTVTLNGRTMATDVPGREFSFDILPSELISAAEVQKTSTADAPEGSIGATVNIRTQRPLDNPGLHVSAAVAGTYDSMSGNTKPKMSGLISKANADGTMGALLSVVHYRRSHVGERATTQGWLHGDRGVNGIAVPRLMNYGVFNEERTRSGVNAAFDWHPSDIVKLNVDAMYSKYDIKVDGRGMEFFTTVADIEAIEADGNNTATWFRRNTSGEMKPSNLRFSELNLASTRDSTNKQLGAHLNWRLGEQTTLDVDGSWSKAENHPDPNDGFFMNLGHLTAGLNPEWTLNPGGFPSYSNLPDLTDTSDVRMHYLRRGNTQNSDQVGEFKTHLTHSFLDGTLSRLQFGVSASTRSKDSQTIRTPDAIDLSYLGHAAKVPEELLQIFTGGNVAGTTNGPTQWLTYDPETIFSWVNSADAWGQFEPSGAAYDPNDPGRAQRIRDALINGVKPAPRPLESWKVRERNYAAFAQADFEGDLGMMPWKLNVGVRYIRTDLTSSALVAEVESITPNPIDYEYAEVVFKEPSLLIKRSSYHDWLPSLNFRLNLREDLLLRVSASETLTRPTLTNLRANETLLDVRLPAAGAYDTGNPDLKPYTSKNVDLGLEWYINDTSYLAVAGFYKNVSNFVTMITTPTTILGQPFLHTRPVNGEGAIIKGAELSFQHTFDYLPAPFDGLGVQLNYTAVDSQQVIDPTLASGQFSVVGLSDSANLVLFYEKDRFGIRAAWNWREEYLAAIRGEEGEPTTVNTYDQLDLSANFKLTDSISLFADATNLTGEKESAWQRYRNRIHWIADHGRTVTFGIRGNW